MTKYQHFLKAVHIDDVQDLLDKYGAAGWTVSSHSGPVDQYDERFSFVFSRPIPE